MMTVTCNVHELVFDHMWANVSDKAYDTKTKIEKAGHLQDMLDIMEFNAGRELSMEDVDNWTWSNRDILFLIFGI